MWLTLRLSYWNFLSLWVYCVPQIQIISAIISWSLFFCPPDPPGTPVTGAWALSVGIATQIVEALFVLFCSVLFQSVSNPASVWVVPVSVPPVPPSSVSDLLRPPPRDWRSQERCGSALQAPFPLPCRDSRSFRLSLYFIHVFLFP